MGGLERVDVKGWDYVVMLVDARVTVGRPMS